MHHFTAIAGPAQRNYDFYTKVLGLRFVKKTKYRLPIGFKNY
jgi:glyoxalase family protein